MSDAPLLQLFSLRFLMRNGGDPRLPDLVARWVEETLCARGWHFPVAMGIPGLLPGDVRISIQLDVDIRGRRERAMGHLLFRSDDDLNEDKIVAQITEDVAKLGGVPTITPPGSAPQAPQP